MSTTTSVTQYIEAGRVHDHVTYTVSCGIQSYIVLRYNITVSYPPVTHNATFVSQQGSRRRDVLQGEMSSISDREEDVV